MTRHWRHTPCGVWQLRCKPGSRFSCWLPILFLPVSLSGPFSWDLCCAWYWCGETRSVFCLTSLLGKLGCLAGGFLVRWSAGWTLLSWETGRSRWLQSWFCWSLPTTLLPSLRWGSLLPASWWLWWSLALLWSITLGCLHAAVAFLIQVVPSFSVMSSCHLLLGRPLVLFPLLGCYSVHRLVHLLSFNLAIWPAHFHFCFSVYSMISMIFVLFLISEHGILSFSFRSNIFLSIALWAVLSLFVICLFRDHVWQP